MISPKSKLSYDKAIDNTAKAAGYKVNKAVRLWRRHSRKEEEVWLLSELRKRNIGTRNTEEFIRDLRGEKISKGGGSQAGKANNHNKTNKNTKKSKNT